MQRIKRNQKVYESSLQTRESEVLVTLAKVLIAPERLVDKLAQVLQELVKVTHADRVSLGVPELDGERLRLIAATSVGEREAITVLAAGQGVSSLAYQRGEVVVVNDYASSPKALTSIVQTGIRSMVALPVQTGGRTLGVINVGFIAPGPNRVPSAIR